MKAGVKSVIPDASVILKWIFKGEEDGLQALNLKKDFSNNKVHIFVPAFFFVELANVLVRKIPEEALALFSKIKLLPFVECPLTLELTSMAMDLMAKHAKISFYEALYHALAKSLKGQFLTADQKYFQTVKKEGSIRLLKDYSSPTKG